MNESKWVRSRGTGMSTENKFIKKRSAQPTKIRDQALIVIDISL